MEKVILDKTKEDNLESLTEELIQVFIFENIDKSSDSQKEDLMQQVLKLGGDNYTYEDLKRDFLIIEGEDKNSKSLKIIKDVPIIAQGNDPEESGLKKLPLTDDRLIEDQVMLAEHILQELENEDKDQKEGKQSKITLNAQENIEQLGIQMNQEGINSPKCGKVKAKRGRKSLKELREADGQAKDQSTT